MKECFKCGKVKLLSEFYTHNRMADGHLNKCKECTRKDSLNHKELKMQDENFAAQEAERHRLKSRNYRATHDIETQSSAPKKKWARKNPAKVYASRIVNNLLKSGKITKLPCEVCGEEKSQAHHDNYLIPQKVRWLCSKHHGEVHTQK